MSLVTIDIETIPDQSENAIADIAEHLTVKAPDLTKPKLIDALELGSDGKFKTVPELKEMWVDRFGEQAKQEQAEAKWLKTSFDGGCGQICCICMDIDGVEFSLTTTGSDNDLLIDFWKVIKEECDSPYFIAHNAKFDLPFLYHRSIVNSVAPSAYFKPHGRHGSSHFCTMEGWAGYNGKISLDNLAKILGLGSKTEGMDGSQVWTEFQKGNIEKIRDYCLDDIRLTKAIYERLTIK